MPFFRYSAKDRQGRELIGTIQAATQDEARYTLSQRGLVVTGFLDGASATPQKQQVAPAPTPAQISQAAPAPLPRHRTIVGRDKDRFFLFAQLASALKAGINPAQAFDDVKNRSQHYYRASLIDLHQAAVEGRDLAEVMESYPDLYPEHVSGMVRAGQMGGYLQEAFEEISTQAQVAHKYRRWFFWVFFVIANALVSIPGMIWAMQSLVQAWKNIDATGGEIGTDEALRLVGHGFVQQLIWPGGPTMLLVWVIYIGFSRTLGARFAKRFRHRIGLRVPPYGKRAKHENLTRFSWSMSRLSKAGFPPARSWQLAADTVPNLEMRDQLLEVAGKLSGAEKMSDIIHGSRLFPDEYSSMVATAEYTGNLPGIMDQLADHSRGEMLTAENYSKVRSGIWGCLGCFATSAAMLGIFWYFMYYVLTPTIVNGINPDG